MHRALLGAAASLAALTAASPALAQGAASTGSFSAVSGGHSFKGVLRAVPANSRRSDFRRGGGDFRHGGRHFRHVHVGDDFAGGGFGYLGYNDYGDYDANRSFDPDKWNDWWHERPERAFPRWVWNNQNCTMDRMWYSGSGWRCTP